MAFGIVRTVDLMKKGLRPMFFTKSAIFFVRTVDLMKKGLRLGDEPLLPDLPSEP